MFSQHGAQQPSYDRAIDTDDDLSKGPDTVMSTALDSEIASTGITQVVSAALIVMAPSRVVPLSATQFYIHGLAAVVAMWPLGYVTWTIPRRSHGPSPAIVG